MAELRGAGAWGTGGDHPCAPAPPGPPAVRVLRAGAGAAAARHRLGVPKALGALATVVLLVAGWWALAPPQVGGSTSYAITEGVSMLPHFHAGDLVLLRKEPGYHVGEVAGFHDPQLGAVVMHRIVAIHGSHFVFKGDNNRFATTYEPTRSQIVGAEWVHLAGAGRYLMVLRLPAVAAVLLGMLWVFTFAPPARSRRRRRRHRHAG